MLHYRNALNQIGVLSARINKGQAVNLNTLKFKINVLNALNFVRSANIISIQNQWNV